MDLFVDSGASKCIRFTCKPGTIKRRCILFRNFPHAIKTCPPRHQCPPPRHRRHSRSPLSAAVRVHCDHSVLLPRFAPMRSPQSFVTPAPTLALTHQRRHPRFPPPPTRARPMQHRLDHLSRPPPPPPRDPDPATRLSSLLPDVQFQIDRGLPQAVARPTQQRDQKFGHPSRAPPPHQRCAHGDFVP